MEDAPVGNFLGDLIRGDLAAGRHDAVITRFPPEPNGYLHIGHAKSITVNFGLAAEFGGRCHLRFDDTNPAKEDPEYVEAIQRDVKWLGFDWGPHLYHASDYFEQMWVWAQRLVREGKAFVCSLSEEETRATRGTVTEPGTVSPFASRPVEESLDLMARMRRGDFPDGAHTVRARIDMAHVNMKMRDPVMYRIRNVPHDRTGDAWHVYPIYDWAHPLSDAIEAITHSFCTLEFDVNRELYDWYLDQLPRNELPSRPHQTEFARLALAYTVMSKRKLLRLVKEGHVSGWDDPRMPTLSAFRRRGVPASAIRLFCERIGVAKANSLISYTILENAVRDDLDPRVSRRMAVLDPLEVVLENLPESHDETFDVPDYPQDDARTEHHAVPFSRVIYIDREDFAEEPSKKWHRLAPGREVRLRWAYYATCTAVEKDATGRVIRLRCTVDLGTRGGVSPDGRKPKGTLHWVSAKHAVDVETRLVGQLFTVPRPDAEEDFLTVVDPHSLRIVTAKAEPAVRDLAPGERLQLERVGFFIADTLDSRPGAPVLTRIVGLKDTFHQAVGPAAEADVAPIAPLRAPPPSGEKVRSAGLIAQMAPYVAAGLSAEEAEVLAKDEALAALFVAAGGTKAVWAVLAEVRREAKGRALGDVVPTSAVATLAARLDDGTIGGPAVKPVVAELVRSGGDPDAIIDAKGLRQVSDVATIRGWVDAVLAASPAEVAAYRGGKTTLRGFFVGQIMKKSGGRAAAAVVATELDRALDG